MKPPVARQEVFWLFTKTRLESKGGWYTAAAALTHIVGNPVLILMFSPFKLEIVGKTLLILMNVVQIQDQAENNMLFLTITNVVGITEKLMLFFPLFNLDL